MGDWSYCGGYSSLNLTFLVGWKAPFVKQNLNSVAHNLAAFFCNRLGPFPSLMSILGCGYLRWIRSRTFPFLLIKSFIQSKKKKNLCILKGIATEPT